MTATLASTDLPLTDDGWTAELLDIDDECRWHNEVGGDIQIGDAPSFRARFVSPEGAIATVTQNAYVIAAVRDAESMAQLGFDEAHEVDAHTHEDVMLAVSAWNGALTEGDGLEVMENPLQYGWNVVTQVQVWEPNNLDEDRPDRDLYGLDEDRDLGGYLWAVSEEEARAEAADFIRSAASTLARDWYPGNL